MGRKKQEIQGSIMSIDLPVEEPKKKREMSDKQRENLSKGMAALKAKREAKSKKESEEVPESVPEVPKPVVPEVPKPVVPEVPTPQVLEPVKEKKERKPRVVKNYLTTEDFNSFKNELLTTIKKPDTPISTTKPIIQQQIIKETVKERVISGRELLDKLFNL
jgi:hypothetical protein